MRIYEIVLEYSSGRDRYTCYDRYRIACETFKEALDDSQKRIRTKKVMVQSIEVVADTKL